MAKIAKYRLLRRLCEEKGIDREDIAECIERTGNYVSTRMMGYAPWAQDEMFKIMDMLGQPYEHIPYIFPVGGMWAGDIPVHEPSAEEKIGKAMLNLLKEAGVA